MKKIALFCLVVFYSCASFGQGGTTQSNITVNRVAPRIWGNGTGAQFRWYNTKITESSGNLFLSGGSFNLGGNSLLGAGYIGTLASPFLKGWFTSLKVVDSLTLPAIISIPQLPEDYEPDTLLVWKNGRIYFTTKDKLSNNIYPVEPPFQDGTYFVSTDGNDSNPGTFAEPFLTWQKGFTTVTAGDTLVIRGGVYTGMLGIYGSNYYGVRVSARDGTASDTIKVWAYPGETPVLDCSSLSAYAGIRYGILLTNCDYWNIKGLTVKNLVEYAANKTAYTGTGWEINDGTHIKLDQCVVTRSMNGFTVSGTVTALRYVNCDAHHNYDYYDDGGLANGFGGNMAATSTMFFDGCRAWANSDDGWDCYAGHGYITFNDCWAWRNGYDVPTQGNGDGFKVGPPDPNVEEAGVQRTLNNCLAWDNYLTGFDESMDVESSMDMVVYNCVSYRNVRDFGFKFSAAPGTGVTTLRNNIAYLNMYNYQGRERNVTDHNTWDAGAPTINAADFLSTDTTGVSGARGVGGSLPVLNFLKLAVGSDMIDAGVDVGLPFEGAAPDLGSYEKQ